jgi:excisionase family DNA binding protein
VAGWVDLSVATIRANCARNREDPFMEERLLSTVEAARLLGVTRVSVHSSVIEGRLPAQRIDGRWYINQTDVEAYRPRLPSTAGTKRVGPLNDSARRLLALLGEWGSSKADELAVVVELHPGNVRKGLAIAEKLGYVTREGHEWLLTDAGRQWLAQQEVAA